MDDSTPIIDITPHPSDFVRHDDFWAFLRRRKGSIGFFFVLGLAAAFWWILSSPRLFEAESRIMIVRTGPVGTPVSESELASEIELVRDPSHLEKAAARRRANQSDAQVHELQRQLDSSLKVAPAGKSNLVAVQYRNSDPTAAAQTVNQIVDLYLADRRFIFQTGARPANDPAQDLLTAFDAVNHGTVLHAELQGRLHHRLDLENRVTELQAQIRDHQESSASLRKKLATVPERIHDRTQTRVVDQSSKQVEVSEVINPLRQQIESQLITSDTAIAGLQARLEETSKALRAARTVEDQTSSLTSERDRIVERRGGLDTTAAASERSNLRATLINRAEPPYAPVPRPYLILVPAAIAAALLLAFLLAWMIDQFDKPIYTSGDFARASGVPPMDDFARGAGA